MPRRHWLTVIVILACLPAFPAEAQFLSDPASLRHTYEMQTQWAGGLASSREAAALRLLAIAQEVLALPDRPGSVRMLLLGEAVGLAEKLASADQEMGDATTMVRETRERLVSALESQAASIRRTAADADPSERGDLEVQARGLEAEVEALRAGDTEIEAGDPLDSAAAPLSALARVVAEENGRLATLWILQEELRLFLSNLRLFDGMSMPPSARSGGGDGSDPGCQPSACAIGGATPADIPLMHSQTEELGAGQGTAALTPASLARLYELIAAHVQVPEFSARNLVADQLVVTREARVGAGVMAFQSQGNGSSTLSPKASTSLVWSRPLAEGVVLAVEPSVGAQILRGGSNTVTEMAGEVRETLTGFVRNGPSQWLVTSWQKGRYLSKPLSSPGYLEPGRVEGGLVGRLAVPLDSRWQLGAEGGADGVRYEPEDWSSLDRHGLTAAVSTGWRGTTHSARLAVRTSHHWFPHPLVDWEERRQDTRYGLEASGSLEGKMAARLSVVGSWNESRIPAYDFRLGRAALVLSARMGKGSLQASAAYAHQEYLNPGPEGARVAPSDQDSGSVVSLQYGYPLESGAMLMIQGGWSRSQTGFRNQFYERFGISAHVTFRGNQGH